MSKFEWIKMDKRGYYTVGFNIDGKQKELFFSNNRRINGLCRR